MFGSVLAKHKEKCWKYPHFTTRGGGILYGTPCRTPILVKKQLIIQNYWAQWVNLEVFKNKLISKKIQKFFQGHKLLMIMGGNCTPTLCWKLAFLNTKKVQPNPVCLPIFGKLNFVHPFVSKGLHPSELKAMLLSHICKW